jgi:hypothetical protein
MGAGRSAARSAGGASRGDSAPHAGATREQFVSQVHRALGVALRSKEGPVTIHLTPEHLGRLRVDLARSQTGMTARFEAATAEAQKLLESSLPELRSALEARGVQVDRLEVRLAEQPVVDAERRALQEPEGGPGSGSQDGEGPPAETGERTDGGGGGHAHGQRSARAERGDGPGPGTAPQAEGPVGRAQAMDVLEWDMLAGTFEVVV